MTQNLFQPKGNFSYATSIMIGTFKIRAAIKFVTPLLLLLSLHPPAHAAAVEVATKSAPINGVTLSEKFRPNPASPTNLDYSFLDYTLDSTVFYLGPSDRIRRINKTTFNNGKRGVKIGHQSPYRLEGSRIYLKQLPPKFHEDMKAYREDLQGIAQSIPLTELSRNEQLAFWFNLHNVAIIEQLSQHRRSRYTSEKRFGPNKLALHDFKFVEIDGYKLSLRDIRENIVYQHWNDPAVIYGFFLGDVGSPSLQLTAFTGDNVNAILEKNAVEFVNALRGYESHRNRNQVSKIYAETYQFFFPHFQEDLKKHFKKYMRPEIFDLVENVSEFSIAPYEYRVASISAGRSPARIRGGSVASSYDPDTGEVYSTIEDIAGSKDALGQLIRAYSKKRERLKKMGLLESEVIIEDIETEDTP